jgi:hypothetical protein
MNAAEITAICTGVPAIIGAITALIIALRANTKSNVAISASVTPGEHTPLS